MAWSESASLNDRFDATRDIACRYGMGRTYQGWVKASRRFSPKLLEWIGQWWRRTVRTVADAQWQICGWVVMGVDGTKFNLPRTWANERAFGVSGKKNGGPQAYLCTLLHLATGLPWCWKMGQAMASERDLLRRMMRYLPARTLLVADAGFVGYALWRQLDLAGHAFLIRAGANVRLLKKLGYAVREREQIVYLWPAAVGRQSPPLVLRRIEVRDGDRRMCLLTNVLDDKRLSDAQAAKFYAWRWGIELWFRGMKQTLAKRQLRSKAPAQVNLELRWAVTAMGLLGLLGVKAQLAQGGDPKRLSLAAVLRAVRQMMRRPEKRCRRRYLECLLAGAVKDTHVRRGTKTARGWPHKKKDPPPEQPKITEATETQKQLMQSLWLRSSPQ